MKKLKDGLATVHFIEKRDGEILFHPQRDGVVYFYEDIMIPMFIRESRPIRVIPEIINCYSRDPDASIRMTYDQLKGDIARAHWCVGVKKNILVVIYDSFVRKVDETYEAQLWYGIIGSFESRAPRENYPHIVELAKTLADIGNEGEHLHYGGLMFSPDSLKDMIDNYNKRINYGGSSEWKRVRGSGDDWGYRGEGPIVPRKA